MNEISAVDNCEIRWEEDSKYDTEISAANAAWEALAGSDSCVDIEPDAWNTNEDLEWSDVNRPGVSWAGRYYQRAGADDIYLNTYYSDNYGACDRKALAMHELGHPTVSTNPASLTTSWASITGGAR